MTGDPEPQAAAAGTAVYAGTSNPITLRTRHQILTLFAGLKILGPGLVPVSQWWPDEPRPAVPGKAWMLGGVTESRPDHEVTYYPELPGESDNGPSCASSCGASGVRHDIRVALGGEGNECCVCRH